MEDTTITRKQALEDLFLSVRKHLLHCGRSEKTAVTVADKVVADAIKLDTTIEDIRKMRDVFLA